MAIWEYRCYLVPKETQEPIKKVRDKDGFIPEVEKNWHYMNLGNNILQYIQSSYLKTPSWSNKLLIFGDKDNKISISLSENNNVEDILISIHLGTKEWKEFMINLIPICQEFQLHFFDTETFNIKDTTYNNFMSSIKKSSAAKFIINPQKYLNDLQ